MHRSSVWALVTLGWAVAAGGGEKTEGFDADPGWEGPNHRSERFPPRAIRQDFGHSPGTRHARGAAPGEIGGRITPAGEPASYARRIPARTPADRLTASGKLACGEGATHALIGFFNASTVGEWRTANSIVLRIQGRGDVFYAYVEYATGRWRAGGTAQKEFPARGTSHEWTLVYDPDAAGGRGAVTATIDGEVLVCELEPGHKADGAAFDRFGLLNVVKSADGPGDLWIDDVTINGEAEDFSGDPRWEGSGNRRMCETTNIRPRFDFGFSPTNFAGGMAPGELGGLSFRGDCRDADRLAAYGDRVGPLALDRPLRASGKVVLRRAVSDSTTLFGFYHSERSLRVNPSQDSGWPEAFLGFAVEGPSRDGFFVYPAYRTAGGRQGKANGPDRPHILPDGRAHDWTLAYDPTPDGGGRIAVTLDGRPVAVDLSADDRAGGVRFDRFGWVTTWIDGNGQVIYFDDLTYTVSQDRP